MNTHGDSIVRGLRAPGSSLDGFRDSARRFYSRTARAVLALSSMLVGAASQSLSAATLPTGFSETRIATGLSGPTSITLAPDGRIFVCEEGGRVRVIKNGALLPTPFITLTTNVSGERGVLGFEFDPNFATNRFVYIYYTATTPAVHNRVSRFTASSTNPDVVQSGTELVLMDLPNVDDRINHNGGDLHFGPDGKLYIAVGDNQQANNAQSLTSRLGKILRIESNGGIPADNPFLTQTTGANRAIWARGLRNPFRFAFQPGTGRLHINDVSDVHREEINLGGAGRNYGHPVCQGGPCTEPGMTGPIHSYAVSRPTVCAITGGVFYNPQSANFGSEWVGRYFFADFCAGWIKWINPASPGTSTTFATGVSGCVDLEVDPSGALYYLARNNGSVFRVTRNQTCTTAPTITQQPTDRTVPAGASVTFSVGATSPVGCVQSFQWQRSNDGGASFANVAGATSQDLTFSASAGDDLARFRAVVTNGAGSTTSAAAVLRITTCQPPVATILTPVVDNSHKAGDTISYSASATDAEDGDLPASAFRWMVRTQHDDHPHPFLGPITGQKTGTFTIPTLFHGDGFFAYIISLTVTDSCGLTHTVERTVNLRQQNVTFVTNPAGLRITLDGAPNTAPHTIQNVVGIVREIGAPSGQSLNGQTFNFQSWSDGGTQTHNISVPETATTLTANFTAGPAALAWEAEALSRSGGVTQTDANTSGGIWIALQATATGQSIDYTLPNVAAGTYVLKMRSKTHPGRGQFTTSFNGTNVGGTIDQYSASPAYPEHTIGTVTVSTAGNQVVRLTVAGRNAASTAFTISSDTFSLTATTTQPTPVSLEAESLSRTTSGPAATNDTDAAASAGVRVTLASTAVGQWVQFTTPSIPAGTYTLQMSDKHNNNRGILQASVDGANVGATLDQYASPATYPTTTLGTVTFASPGTHTIRLTVTGKNAASSSFTLSADKFTLTPQ